MAQKTFADKDYVNAELAKKANTGHTHNVVSNQDTRAVNTTPKDVPTGLSVHLKSNGTDGLSDGGTYHSTLMIKGWNDKSGGPWGQITVTQNSNLYFRSSASGSDTDWNAWKKASLDGHTHSYAGSSSAGGAATSANKVNQNLAIKLNGGGTEGTNLFTFNGSAAKTINITPANIGAAASSHGTHVPTPQTAQNNVFLRNDNTWAEVKPENIGAATASHGTHVTYSTTAPKVAGTAAVGSEATVARGDHVHPLQTSVSGSSGSCTGNAATATKFASSQSVALTGDVTGSASSQAGWSVATTLANSGVTAGSYGPSANASPAHKGTFSVPYITVDAKGRVTSASTKTITLPADNNSDTKVTNTVNTTTKYYVTGSSNAATNTGTQIFDTNVYVDATAGKFVATTMAVNNKVQMQYNADAESLDFIFI